MPTSSQNAIRVIVVDGIAASRQHLARLLLPALDIEVAALARTGAEGLQLARWLAPDVVVIASLAEDSLQIIAALKRDLPQLPLLLVSTSSDMEYLQRALQAGARRFVPLPPKADQLAQAIRELANT